MELKLVGILNLTPDSFSDGELYSRPEIAIRQAEIMLLEGADFIELGADSTRPGSECVGVEEEWKRLFPVLSKLGGKMPLAVDTHHSEVARRALEFGVEIVNDVSAGQDPAMFSVLASSKAKLVLMYSRCIKPHQFGSERGGDLLSSISSFLLDKANLAIEAGVDRSLIVLDPGMGAFLSDNPERSFELLRRFDELAGLDYPLMLAISRKGFTKIDNETDLRERDDRSVALALGVLEKTKLPWPVYLRVHNVAAHKAALRQLVS